MIKAHYALNHAGMIVSEIKNRSTPFLTSLVCCLFSLVCACCLVVEVFEVRMDSDKEVGNCRFFEKSGL